MAEAIGHGLTAIVEITLDRQDTGALEMFEARVADDFSVQQCYRVSPGPDFCLVVHAKDMPDYQALTQRLFTSDANVRNVKAFFSVKRSKFGDNCHCANRKPLMRRIPLGHRPASGQFAL